MKQLNKCLRDFISTFQLEHPKLGVCFEARIYFFSENVDLQVSGEIHIITINGKGLDVLYILSTTSDIGDIPTMFVIGDFAISFNLYHGLQLKGSTAGFGNFVLVVQPTGKNCIEATYRELYEKAYN